MMNISTTSLLKNRLDRVTKSSKSLIDHVTTTVPQRVRKSGVCLLSISDHNLIYAVRRMVMPRERP